MQECGGAGAVTAATRHERASGEHFVGDRDGVEIASGGVGGVERGGCFDEAAFARETDRAACVDDGRELARFEARGN
ncbi:MAG TPA: hypothetical protein VM509_04925, partial [Planctomycetota bacterium]|nr:hypothetical protein [Planctomycetota bacterium]